MKKQKKLVKQIALLTLTCGMVLPISACGKKDTKLIEASTEMNTEELYNETEQVEDKTDDKSVLEEQYGKRESFQTVKRFMDDLEKENYESILNMIPLPENSIVQPDDLYYYLKRSDFSYLIGQKCELEEFYESGDTVISKIKHGSDIAELIFKLDEEDHWVPQFENLYKENATILSVGKSQLTINGIAIEEDKYAEKSLDAGDGRVVYTLTLPNRPLETTTDTLFGEIKTNLNETKFADFTSISELDMAQSNEVLSAFQDIFNQMLTDAYNGITDVESYTKYFSDEANQEFINNTVAGLLSMVKEYDDITCSEVIKKPDSVIFPATYNRVVANIGYKLTFTWNLDSSGYQTRFSNIKMDKTEDGSYKLYSTTDEGLFTEVNPFTKKY